MTGKYAYNRRKSLTRRKLGSFTEWAISGDIGSQKQTDEIPRKHGISGDASNIVEADACVEHVKVGVGNYNLSSCDDARKHDILDKSLTSHLTTRQKAMKAARVAEGISCAIVAHVFLF